MLRAAGVWTESNPLEAEPLEDMLRQRAQQQQERPLQAFGLTSDQVGHFGRVSDTDSSSQCNLTLPGNKEGEI